jgi:hypothetical protein
MEQIFTEIRDRRRLFLFSFMMQSTEQKNHSSNPSDVRNMTVERTAVRG